MFILPHSWVIMLLYDCFTIALRYSVKLAFSQFTRATKPLDKCKTLFLKFCWSDLGILCILASISLEISIICFNLSLIILLLKSFPNLRISCTESGTWTSVNLTNQGSLFSLSKTLCKFKFSFGHCFVPQ